MSNSSVSMEDYLAILKVQLVNVPVLNKEAELVVGFVSDTGILQLLTLLVSMT